MARANYTHRFARSKGEPFLIIEDRGNGQTTLTVDIQNVVAEIAAKHKIAPSAYNIIYRDSTGVWDGYDARTKRFILLSGQNKEEAIESFHRHKERNISIPIR